MTDSIILLEGLTAETTVLFIALGLIGFVCLRVGWVAYTEPTPRFVLHYNGWSCPPLAMLYGGVAMLIMGGFVPISKLEKVQDSVPDLILGVLGLTWVVTGLIFLLGFFFWFPFFLLPSWYRRARRAGVPRNDPHAMGAFKALPLDQQRAAARRGA